MEIVASRIETPRPQQDDGRWYDRQLVATYANGTERKFQITAHGKVQVQSSIDFYSFYIRDDAYNTTQIQKAVAYCA